MRRILIALIVLIVIIAIYLGYLSYKYYKSEFFDPTSLQSTGDGDLWDPLSVGKRAVDCYTLDNAKCLEYNNCGLCLDNKNTKCVPGDENGPYFKQNCRGWMHTDNYDRYIFGERVTTITPPWSYMYADYEAIYPHPKVANTL